MTNASTLMLMNTVASLHAGSGQSIAGIDLPIQRETHTGWPCVFGSVVKGALRANAERHSQVAERVTELFGPSHAAATGERDSAHAGALMVGDARLLLLPVRSLQSCYRLVTCPALLRRFYRDTALLGQGVVPLKLQPEHAEQALAKQSGDLFLEEFRLQRQACEQIESLADTLHTLAPSLWDREDLADRLTVVSNDIFTFLAHHATAVNAHIALDSATKTVKNGALWYQESLPAETVLYSAITATASRRRGSSLPAEEMLATFAQLLPDSQCWLQLGGNETTGMGWCQVALSHHKGAAL